MTRAYRGVTALDNVTLAFGDGRVTARLGTVRKDLAEAISKLGARTRVEAARLARQKGWLSITAPRPGATAGGRIGGRPGEARHGVHVR